MLQNIAVEASLKLIEYALEKLVVLMNKTFFALFSILIFILLC